jgi:uncharacterized protein YjlB
LLGLIISMVQVFKYLLQDDGVFPNSKFPVIIYRNAFNIPLPQDPEKIEKIFALNDWTNSWRNGIYHFHHYHSIVHEVLGIYSGSCDLILGGEKGIQFTVNIRDVIIIPAGVAHKNAGATHDFKCVGAYPDGKSFDINYGKPGERPQTDKNIQKVPLPGAEPVFGAEGQLFQFWK